MAPVSKPHPRSIQTYLEEGDYRTVRRIAGAECQTVSAFLRKVVLDHIRSHPDGKPSEGERSRTKAVVPRPKVRARPTARAAR